MARSARKTEYVSAEQIGVIYARYSSHNQKEESIEQQIAECSDSPQRTESESSAFMRIRLCLAAPIGARISSA